MLGKHHGICGELGLPGTGRRLTRAVRKPGGAPVIVPWGLASGVRVICGRWEAPFPWAGRLKAGVPAVSSVSRDLENLAALRGGGISPFRAAPRWPCLGSH